MNYLPQTINPFSICDSLPMSIILSTQMNQQESVSIFIGSGDASLLERKTLIYSLHKHTKRPLSVFVFNGTNNTVEHNGTIKPLPHSILKFKSANKWATEFSLYRYLIPELCDYRGKAIYLDSDMICLSDISELFDNDLDDCDFMAKKEEGGWSTSVSLLNCERCRFDLDKFFVRLSQKNYSYQDFTKMKPKFLSHYSYRIKELPPAWNVFDKCDNQTKLIHYTDLNTQPWRFPYHPFGELWFTYFNEAISAGYISQIDIDESIRNAYVRSDLMKGNRGDDSASNRAHAKLRNNILKLRYFIRRQRQRLHTA